MKRRISVWMMPDQLTLNHPALIEAEREVGRDRMRVVMVESRAAMRRLPYHKKRQVLILSAGRHFAELLRSRDYEVDVQTAENTRLGLLSHVKRHKPTRLITIQASEYTPRAWQMSTIGQDLGLSVDVMPNTLFLVGRHNPIPNPQPDKRYLMEHFYRSMRTHFSLLIEADGNPVGGRWNFDRENRKPLPKSIEIPPRISFPPDDLTRDVMREVEAHGHGIGSVEGFDDAIDHSSAEAAFQDFLQYRLPHFGTYEDAMSRSEGILFHSKLSLQMNLGLLDPLEMALAAEQEFHRGRAPLNSVEGFIRQIIGWREFIYWQYHRQMPELRGANAWNASRPIPRMFWDGATKLECVRSVVSRLIETGYTHHIERLMVLTNFAMLAGLNPAAVADWFLTFYADSHEWVVCPNVIGMGLNADEGMTATKPYICSSSYLNRMSDFCRHCEFDRNRRVGDNACPFNYLYWNFLMENESALRANPRLGPAVLGLKNITEQERRAIRQQASEFLASLEFYDGEDINTTHF